MIHIGLQPEYVLSFHGFLITNTFLTSLIVTCLLLFLGMIYYMERDNHQTFIIKAIRAATFQLLKFIDMVTEERAVSKRVFPLIATFFVFIVTANLLGLLPGFLGAFFIQTTSGPIPIFKSPNSDLSTTIALALVSVIAIQYFSVRMLGAKGYIGRFVNFTGPIAFILGFFDIISESAKIISFSFRLFGNIFAGEVLLLVVAFLVPYALPLPFMILEVFVGIIQAFIFAALTLTFIQSSTLSVGRS
jgi:F-type H+-transporting ATPase subunit a